MNTIHTLSHLSTLVLYTAESKTARLWNRTEMSWSDFQDLICDVEAWADEKDCGGYVPGEFTGAKGSPGRAKRHTDTLVSRSVVTLDFDSAESDALEKLEKAGIALAGHTTWSHTPEAPRWRVLVPLSRPVSAEEYRKVSAVLASRLQAVGEVDPASFKPAQFMFWPATDDPDVAEAYTTSDDTEIVDVDALLSAPEVAGDDTLGEGEHGTGLLRAARGKKDPFELAGVPGAFNRLYGTDTAKLIADFDLPYEPSPDPTRWRFKGAKSAAGFGPIHGREGLWFSNHAKDPVFGYAQSAFDLVRVHTYGILDAGVDPKTPVNRLPSTEACIREVSKIQEVAIAVASADFADEDGNPLEIGDWRLELKRGDNGRVLKNSANIRLIAQHDKVMSKIAFNELTNDQAWVEPPPWRDLTTTASVNEADLSELSFYFEEEYKLKPARAELFDWVTVAANTKRFHPIREYLESLEWDGVKRLETCLPGVKPTEYTRMVARKALSASAGRMLDPGLKFDHMPIIRGPEGLGKTWWLEKMARRPEWMCDLGDVTRKDTVQAAHESWLVVSDEGHSMRRADANALKSFITQTSDKFRPSHARQVVTYKRAFTFWATTNDQIFLTAQQGNRRYLVLEASEKVDFNRYTDEYVDQLWAEAVATYRAGEQLYLTPEEEAMAEQARHSSVEENMTVSVVENYLCRRYPEDYLEWPPGDRREWLSNGGHAGADSIKLDNVSPVQIWTESFPDARYRKIKQPEVREIKEGLIHLGWKAVGRKYHKHYGMQTTYQPPHGWDYGPDRGYDPEIDEPEIDLGPIDFEDLI